jgi:hypothetical protein
MCRSSGYSPPLDTLELRYLDTVKELLRKLDDACEAGKKLRARVAKQMRTARADEHPALDDAAVTAARKPL